MVSQKNIFTLATVLSAFSLYGEAQSPAETIRSAAGVKVEETARTLTTGQKETLEKITQSELKKLLAEGADLPAVGQRIMLGDKEYLVVADEVVAPQEDQKEDTDPTTPSGIAEQQETASTQAPTTEKITAEVKETKEVAAPKEEVVEAKNSDDKEEVDSAKTCDPATPHINESKVNIPSEK